jgi:ubiquinone/menaquinone biosynthesis C-methylase UbiE
MNILEKIKKSINHFYNTKNNIIKSPESAYNIWAKNYDNEKDNLILHYDNIILKELISRIQLKDKIIFDYGCGTGRNWPLLLDKNPAKVIGCDISQKMLHRLIEKYPNAEVYKSKDLKSSFLPNNTCDIIISTLVIAHITDIQKMFLEWERIMKNKSDIIITDFHPELLAKGGVRTFKNGREVITVENYYHSIKTIEEILAHFRFKVLNFIEKNIDENVKHFYEKQNALKVYEKFYNTPFIYGIHLSR